MGNWCKGLLTGIGGCALLGLVLCIFLGLLLHGGSFGSRSYDCSVDFDRWVSRWPSDKKDWCCANQNVGCKPPIRGCETECNYKRQTATCAERIRWGPPMSTCTSPMHASRRITWLSASAPFATLARLRMPDAPACERTRRNAATVSYLRKVLSWRWLGNVFVTTQS